MWVAFTGRNRRPTTFHLTRADYIRSGLSLCGKDMTRNGWTTGDTTPAAHLKTCKRCKRLAQRG